MDEKEYIERLKKENRILQDKLDKITRKKSKRRRFRKWLFKKSTTPLFGRRLKRSISTAINEFKEYKTLSVDTVSDVSTSIIWRVTRIGLFAILFAVLPALVLFFQTKLLMNQNELITNQNSLVEAERRSSLVFVMDNVLSDLNDELKYKGISSRNTISNTLEARIVSLSRAMQPYQYIEDGKLIEKKTSLERGQLLYSLIKSDLDNQSLGDIFNVGSFDYSYLKEVFLGRGAYLKYIKLNNAVLTQANMPGAELSNSEFDEAQMENINLSDAILKRSRLKYANLHRAELAGADFTQANISGSDLSKADLSEAILWGTKIEGVDFTDTNLNKVIVHRKDWLAYVSDSLDLDGSSSIKKKYKLQKQGKEQFVLVKR